jgi:hypothetical protein
LPLVVEGSRKALPKNSWIFGPKSDIHLQILDPVTVDASSARSASDLRDEVRSNMMGALEQLRARLNHNRTNNAAN